jgi:hypothetical protein
MGQPPPHKKAPPLNTRRGLLPEILFLIYNPERSITTGNSDRRSLFGCPLISVTKLAKGIVLYFWKNIKNFTEGATSR